MDYKWETVTEEQLKHLYYDEGKTDREIADLFRVTMGKVAYRKRKLGISSRNKLYQQTKDQNGELFRQLNEGSKARVWQRENVGAISRAVAHYALSGGPIEEMQASRQLSQQDAKALGKYMVNRIAGLLTTALDGDWLQLELLFSSHRLWGESGEVMEPDMGEMKGLMEKLKKS